MVNTNRNQTPQNPVQVPHQVTLAPYCSLVSALEQRLHLEAAPSDYKCSTKPDSSTSSSFFLLQHDQLNEDSSDSDFDDEDGINPGFESDEDLDSDWDDDTEDTYIDPDFDDDSYADPDFSEDEYQYDDADWQDDDGDWDESAYPDEEEEADKAATDTTETWSGFHLLRDYPASGMNLLWTEHFVGICYNRALEACHEALYKKELKYCE